MKGLVRFASLAAFMVRRHRTQGLITCVRFLILLQGSRRERKGERERQTGRDTLAERAAYQIKRWCEKEWEAYTYNAGPIDFKVRINARQVVSLCNVMTHTGCKVQM